MTGGIRTLNMMPPHDFSAPLKKQTIQQKQTNRQLTTEETPEDPRKVSPVIRPIVGPWVPGAILNQGAQTNSSSDHENPTILLPQRHLSLALEALRRGGGRKRSSDSLNDLSNGPSVKAGTTIEENAEKKQDFLSLDWAGTNSYNNSSSKNRCFEDLKSSPFFLNTYSWLPTPQRTKNSGNGNDFDDHFHNIPDAPAKKEQKKERKSEHEMEQKKDLKNESKKEQKKEHYMEMKATGLATFQHLDFLMKHLEILIEQAEERLGEPTTVHAAHSRLVQERHNAEAVDSCAKAAIEQLETLRRGLSFVLPNFNGHQQFPEKRKESQERRESVEEETEHYIAKLPGVSKVSATKQQKTAVKVEKETSLTLDCGGSYERLSPGSSGDSGGESTCEDDVVEIKNHENPELIESKTAFWAQSIGQSLTSNMVSPSNHGSLALILPSPSPSSSPSHSPSGTQLPENINVFIPERHSPGIHVFSHGTPYGGSPCYSSFSPDLTVSTPHSGVPSFLPTAGKCSSEKPSSTVFAPTQISTLQNQTHVSPSTQTPISSEVVLPSLNLKAETASTDSMEEEEEEEAEEKKESAVVVTWKHQGNGQDASQRGTPSKRQRTRQQEEEVPGDTWHWRKYGQKVIKDTQLYRSYYRCGCRKGTTCPAKRHVDRYIEDNTVKSVVYEGEHCHPQPPPKTRTTILIRNSPKTGKT